MAALALQHRFRPFTEDQPDENVSWMTSINGVAEFTLLCQALSLAVGLLSTLTKDTSDLETPIGVCAVIFFAAPLLVSVAGEIMNVRMYVRQRQKFENRRSH